MIAYIKEKKITGLNYIQNENSGGGSGDCDLDFTQIGYEGTPQSMIDDLEYAKEIQANWDATIEARNGTFANDSKLVYCPYIDVSNATNTASFFSGCQNLQYIPKHLDLSRSTNLIGFFQGCTNIRKIDMSNWVFCSEPLYFRSMFRDCTSLAYVNLTNFDTSKTTSWGEYSGPSVFLNNSSLRKIDGFLDYSSAQRNGYDVTYTFSGCTKLQKLEVRNVGKHSGMTVCYFFGGSTYYNGDLHEWGENTEDIPDARESMINTLITYSFDRASAGYATCDLMLAESTKARLTEEEIAQITEKGYTIA